LRGAPLRSRRGRRQCEASFSILPLTLFERCGRRVTTPNIWWWRNKRTSVQYLPPPPHTHTPRDVVYLKRESVCGRGREVVGDSFAQARTASLPLCISFSAPRSLSKERRTAHVTLNRRKEKKHDYRNSPKKIENTNTKKKLSKRTFLKDGMRRGSETNNIKYKHTDTYIHTQTHRHTCNPLFACMHL
jgi:hypothetical protein